MKKVNALSWFSIAVLVTLMGCDPVVPTQDPPPPPPPAQQVTLTFDTQGGTSIAPLEVTAGAPLPTITAPTRTNYNFAGWFKDQAYTQAFNPLSDMVNENTTLYADWEYIEGSPETFLSADQPEYQKSSGDVSGFMIPWNYDKPFNSHRKYPIIIGLHGSGAPGGYMPFICWSSSEKQAYPAFLLAPHTTSSDWATETSRIIAEVESLKSQYRIDTNRIYITGFSMGGGGSYSLADAFYKHDGTIPAAIVRFSGQFKPSLSAAVTARTSVWYHSGLSDSAARIAMARDAYAYFKGVFTTGAETLIQDTWTSTDGVVHDRTTQTWTVGGADVFKLTEWTGADHSGTSAYGAKYPGLLTWLFSKNLKNRP